MLSSRSLCSSALGAIILSLSLTCIAPAQSGSSANSPVATDVAQTTPQTRTTPASGPPSTSVPDAPIPAAQNDITPGTAPSAQQSEASPALTQQEKAEQQLRQQEKQRVAGVVPNFNVSYDKDAPPADPQVFEMGLPVLGICYGLQFMVYKLGGN